MNKTSTLNSFLATCASTTAKYIAIRKTILQTSTILTLISIHATSASTLADQGHSHSALKLHLDNIHDINVNTVSEVNLLREISTFQKPISFFRPFAFPIVLIFQVDMMSQKKPAQHFWKLFKKVQYLVASNESSKHAILTSIAKGHCMFHRYVSVVVLATKRLDWNHCPGKQHKNTNSCAAHMQFNTT